MDQDFSYVKKMYVEKESLEAEIDELEEIIYQNKVECLNDLLADKKQALKVVAEDLILVEEMIASL